VFGVFYISFFFCDVQYQRDFPFHLFEVKSIHPVPILISGFDDASGTPFYTNPSPKLLIDPNPLYSHPTSFCSSGSPDVYWVSVNPFVPPNPPPICFSFPLFLTPKHEPMVKCFHLSNSPFSPPNGRSTPYTILSPQRLGHTTFYDSRCFVVFLLLPSDAS